MIKKVCLLAAFIVLSTIVTIVVLGANAFDEPKECITSETVVYDAIIDTNEEITDSSKESKKIDQTDADTSINDTRVDEVDETTIESANSSPINEPVKNYTEEDLYYLAAAVCIEAGGESEEIRLLVANVIINRVNSPIYPDTIYGVLTEYRQYGLMWKQGVSFPEWADQETIESCYAAARRILDGERFCPDNVLFQAEFEQGIGVFKKLGDYFFCYYE